MTGYSARRLSLATLVGVGLIGIGSPAHAAAPKSTLTAPPDFTKGEKPDQSHDWTLGPTGARGWIYTAHGHSADARQILVTSVTNGSPSEGVLKPGDVILGVGAGPFTGDARIQFANAITAAEAAGGQLRLTRWRAGTSAPVAVKLPVLGKYSDTAPYNCPKSDRIFEQGCQALAARMARPDYAKRLNPIPRCLNALALLASGNVAHRPLLQQEAKWAAAYATTGFRSWYYGYVMMFLSEYVMATGDTSVLPGLNRLAMEAVRGQSKVGTWGHNFASEAGNASGYGCMNQPGITLCIGLVLAREAGVKDPTLDAAITKAVGFLRWFVNKGAIPYGDHQPYNGHEDNGKCSSGAVLFDLVKDREAAAFFGKMATAAYSEREQGHTGNFFNVLWALPGVARVGPVAAGAYLKETAWYSDLARGWDGAFAYQGAPVGQEEHNKYTTWDCSGGYLLAYGLPRTSLRITGKAGSSVPPLTAAQVADVIAAGRDYPYQGMPNGYAKRSTDDLLAGLKSWSPAVRTRSANELAKRPGDFVPALLGMLSGSDRDAQYGAIEAIEYLGPKADRAAAKLRVLLTDSDPWLQSLAAMALPALSPEVRQASVGDLLRMTVAVNPADPRRMAQRAAGVALFAPFPGARGPKSILADSLDGVDRDLLYPAVKSILQNEDSVARGAAARTFGRLTDRDLVELLPVIATATDELAPSNEMFGDGVRLAGLDLMARLHVREGLPLCVSVIEPGRWGAGKRLPKCLDSLTKYGTHAKAYLPQLKEMRKQFAKTPEDVKTLDAAIANIEAGTATPTLPSIAEFKTRTPPKKK